MSSEDILLKHFEICESFYVLLQEENCLLKQESPSLKDDFLAKKRTLLSTLEKSVSNLKDMQNKGVLKSQTEKDLIRNTQNKLMKIFALDQENEKLLLKHNIKTQFIVTQQKKPVTVEKLKSIYMS